MFQKPCCSGPGTATRTGSITGAMSPAGSFPRSYDLITAWDSTFHLPLASQKPALINMCSGLTAQGVLMFTCGPTQEPGEISDIMEGLEFGYSTLGIPGYLHTLLEQNMAVRHLEYDQGPEGRHVCIIAQKAD